MAPTWAVPGLFTKNLMQNKKFCDYFSEKIVNLTCHFPFLTSWFVTYDT